MLTYAVFSDKGDRSYNEDSTYAVATENEGCFALADSSKSPIHVYLFLMLFPFATATQHF